MIDMYGQEVGVGESVLTWVKEGNGIELKHVVVTKVNPKTIEFTYDYVPIPKYYSPSTNVAKRKSNQIMLLHHFKRDRI